MKPLVRVGVALGAALAVAAVGYAVEPIGAAPADALGPGVVTLQVHIHHSAFDLGHPQVRVGTLVEFVVHNDDPIDHELVVGDDAVHLRHEHGTEARHPPVPGEVSIAPGRTAMTFYRFTTVGPIVYACHLPGHLAYGMQGTIEVVPAV